MIGLTIVCLVTMEMYLRNGKPKYVRFIDEDIDGNVSLHKTHVYQCCLS
jgi:hypothetical protein